jgi:hypothetical protein
MAGCSVATGLPARKATAPFAPRVTTKYVDELSDEK